MYFESPRKGKGNARYVPVLLRSIRVHRDRPSSFSPRAPIRTSENQVVRPGEQDLYIKLTYSVIREDVKEASHSKDADKLKKPPKWHMSTHIANPLPAGAV